jgi:26S proteasome regulatory subunit N7
MSDEIVLPIPNLELAQHRFVLSQPSLKHLHTSSRDALLAGIKADSMAPYLRSVLSSKELASDKTNESLLKELEQTNEAELKKFEERRAEAEKLEGETDVVEAIRDKANYLTKIGDKVGLSLSLRNVDCTHAT